MINVKLYNGSVQQENLLKSRSAKYKFQKFESENELSKTLITNLCKNRHKRTKANSNVKLYLEVPVGSGITDVILACLNENLLSKRIMWGLSKPITNHVKITIINLFENRNSVTISDLVRKFHGDSTTLIRNIEQLISDGYLAKDHSDTVKRPAFLRPLIKKAISIETKTEKWQEALVQAYRNKLFADESYVAFDEANANRIMKHIDEFKKSDVGVYLVSKMQKDVYVLYKPKKDNKLSPYFRFLLSEQVVKSETSKLRR